MLLDEKPSDVGEEESTSGVVGISVSLNMKCMEKNISKRVNTKKNKEDIYLGMLVVHAVVAGPVPDAALVGDGVGEHQEDTQRESGLVRAMSP